MPPLIGCLVLAQDGSGLRVEELDPAHADLTMARICVGPNGERLYLYYRMDPELDDGSLAANPRIRRLLREGDLKRTDESWPNNQAQDMHLAAVRSGRWVSLTEEHMRRHYPHLSLVVDPVEPAEEE